MTRGQVRFEWNHLRVRLERRDPLRYDQAAGLDMPEVDPLFELIGGGIAGWKKGGESTRTGVGLIHGDG